MTASVQPIHAAKPRRGTEIRTPGFTCQWGRATKSPVEAPRPVPARPRCQRVRTEGAAWLRRSAGTKAEHGAKTPAQWRTFYQPMPKRWAFIKSEASFLHKDRKGIFLAAPIHECPSSPALFLQLLWSPAASRASRAFARKALMAAWRRSLAMVPAAPIGTT